MIYSCDVCGINLDEAPRRIAIMLAGAHQHVEEFVTITDLCMGCHLGLIAGRLDLIEYRLMRIEDRLPLNPISP